MKAPASIETERLIVRKPVSSDAEEIFTRYASDSEVTRYLSWPTHRSIDATIAFLAFSEAEWERWPSGPYLVERKSDQLLLGGTGLAFESPEIASTGYVFAKDAWGQGYATEALAAVIQVADELGVRYLYAHCHPEHRRSMRVLEKSGFINEALLPGRLEFPNLTPGRKSDCLQYVRRDLAGNPNPE